MRYDGQNITKNNGCLGTYGKSMKDNIATES